MKNIISFLLLLILINTQKTESDWIQTSGPQSGHISSFTMSGTNIFTGTYGSGIFLSTNNSTSWVQAYSVTWDASKCSSGVYFYKLSATGGAGNYSETKRMVFIKRISILTRLINYIIC